MRKRGAQPRHRAKSLPGLIVQQIDVRYELRLRQCVEAFRHGCADPDHHADLADCRDDSSAVPVLDIAGIALTNILERATDRGRWGCSGDELHALELMAEFSIDFWNRRSGALYYAAYSRLKHIRIAQARARMEDAA